MKSQTMDQLSIRAREAAGTLGEIAALLHDLVEDTDTTLAELREIGFNPIVVDAVDHLTRRDGESYSDFITRCNEHDVARLVKIADIEDNLEDQSALEPEEAEFLKKRYEKALLTLKGD
jgi:guanosine-3',5'-bis(diphosphate) 3'-pyrophosphohydrolase